MPMMAWDRAAKLMSTLGMQVDKFGEGRDGGVGAGREAIRVAGDIGCMRCMRHNLARESVAGAICDR